MLNYIFFNFDCYAIFSKETQKVRHPLITVTYSRTPSLKRSLSRHCLFAIDLILFQFNVRSSCIFDYLVLCLSSLRPAYPAQVSPHIYVYIYMYINIYIYINMYICIYIYIFKNVYV